MRLSTNRLFNLGLLTGLLLIAGRSLLLGQISGTFTVGTGGDFASLSEAIDTLNRSGVSGAVNLEVLPGRYFEQVRISRIPGASSSTPVSIYAQTGQASDVIFEHAASNSDDNFLIHLDTTAYIHISHLTLAALGSNFARIIRFSGFCRSISLRMNTLNGVSGNPISIDRAAIYGDSLSETDSLVLQENQINTADIGIYLDAAGPAGGADQQIIANQLENVQCGMYLGHQRRLHIEANQISSTTESGISLIRAEESLVLQKNQVVASQEALLINQCRFDSSSTARIINNFFISRNSDGVAVSNSSKLRFYHNSVLTHSAQFTRAALSVAAGDSLLHVVNNLLACSGPGLAYRVADSASVTESDYNNFFTRGPYIAEWNSQLLNLGNLQQQSGMDSHSLAVDPHFVSSLDLHARSMAMDNAGLPLPGISDDIDGQLRSQTHPDIGADEYSGVVAIAALPTGNQPESFSLAANYPNPFNPSTNVEFGLQNREWVRLDIYDIRGGRIRTLVNALKAAGTFSVQWDGTDDTGQPVSSGVYVYRLEAGDYVQSRKMVLLR